MIEPLPMLSHTDPTADVLIRSNAADIDDDSMLCARSFYLRRASEVLAHKFPDNSSTASSKNRVNGFEYGLEMNYTWDCINHFLDLASIRYPEQLPAPPSILIAKDLLSLLQEYKCPRLYNAVRDKIILEWSSNPFDILILASQGDDLEMAHKALEMMGEEEWDFPKEEEYDETWGKFTPAYMREMLKRSYTTERTVGAELCKAWMTLEEERKKFKP